MSIQSSLRQRCLETDLITVAALIGVRTRFSTMQNDSRVLLRRPWSLVGRSNEEMIRSGERGDALIGTEQDVGRGPALEEANDPSS